MLFNSTKLLLTNTMMIGVIMTICSNNWISMWMGLEISLLSFIPFMQTDNQISSESMIKYFIMQSAASTMMLLSVVTMLVGGSMFDEIIMTVAMLIKIGSVPFHNWVIMIIESLSYYTIFTLLTILKIPPLSILYQTSSQMLNIPIMLSMVISSISCLNQSSVRKTLGYSSIYNMAMIMLVINSYCIMLVYLILYSITMIMLINMTKKLKINFINQMLINEHNMNIKINLWLNMLSMGGFPPLIGFIGKLLVIQMMILNNEVLLMVIMVLTSMLVIMFYMRMAFTSLMSISLSKKWMTNKTNSSYFIMLTNLTLTPLMISLSSIA
uniref:NADH dehydrogenase subunit 2 n=1 Tax=Phlogotettix cyclops TaxID=317764 RepID=UPI001EDE677C|nr:NADH dehydrogenase subunit 2 [Phlogotettix cyclops]UKE80352.1 NADH dehydrogenase subunit 2 [Phlogotettix cyclops]